MEPQCDGSRLPNNRQDVKGQQTTTTPPLVAGETTNVKSTINPNNGQQAVNNECCLRRSTTSLDVKYKCAITSERLAQLKKIVEIAVKEHKIFTVKGGWQTLRNCFLRRNWVEKCENNNNANKKPQSANPLNQSSDDITSNLPSKQDWESPSAYIDKCEKTIMSRLLANHEVDFYWNMRKDQSEWHHRMNVNKLMNRFSRSLYTSKEGLALLLQQMYWHNDPGVAAVNFPRCYVLGFPDHYQSFVDDFRLTACISLLKWFVYSYQSRDEHLIKDIAGKVPFSALQFATDRCNEFIASRKHLDIDRDFVRIWDHEWDQFLSNYYLIIHHNALFIDSKDLSLSMLNASAKTTLKDVAKYWPDFTIDGMRNIWILKPGNKCRGRGIQLVKHVEDVAKIMNLKLKYVVQKYIERPLVIYKTKFDIRQWFLISSVYPLNIWMYRENYLRFSSQIFTLDNFHESLHLTNHAVQCKYTNVNQRDKALPDENMWDCHTFQAYLKQIGHMDKWNDVIVPGIREGIIGAMLASQDTMDRRPNTFELYGADFMIAEDFTPWLIEINASPDLSSSTSITARMCPQVLEDLVKVIIDKRRDPKADTGMFELIFKQNYPRPPAYLGMNLSVRGRRIFKNRSKNKKETGENKSRVNKDVVKAEYQQTSLVLKQLPKILSPDLYKGPIIEDLIEGIQHSFYNCGEHGVDFVPAVAPSLPMKKKIAIKHERVPKSCHTTSITKPISKPTSVCRKQNVKENNKKIEKKAEAKLNITEVGTFDSVMSTKRSSKLVSDGSCDIQKLDLQWERETTSILNNKHLMSFNEMNINKNVKMTRQCLSSNLYSLLPQIKISRTKSDESLALCDKLFNVTSNYKKMCSK